MLAYYDISMYSMYTDLWLVAIVVRVLTWCWFMCESIIRGYRLLLTLVTLSG